jgi:ankyrin repeat protein
MEYIRTKAVAILLDTDKVNVNLKDPDGRTPLSWAAESGSEAVVKFLFNIGIVDVDSKDRDGQTPLLWATRNGREAVVELIQSHVDLP